MMDFIANGGSIAYISIALLLFQYEIEMRRFNEFLRGSDFELIVRPKVLTLHEMNDPRNDQLQWFHYNS
jgi:hypothetical protein